MYKRHTSQAAAPCINRFAAAVDQALLQSAVGQSGENGFVTYPMEDPHPGHPT